MADLEKHLDSSIRRRKIDQVNGLTCHILEAGFDGQDRPLILLLHGFPELAFSWRHILVPLAELGFHVVAPDQRGYGATTGWSADYDTSLYPFSMFNLVQDCLALTHRLGYQQVHAVIGHDFGSPVAGWCALTRPDIFKSVVMMSAPFDGPPPLLSNSNPTAIHEDLATLDRPRKHYQWYYSEVCANSDMMDPINDLKAFLRAYYHVKSADWPQNNPIPLEAWDAQSLANLPTYYVMDFAATMPESVAPFLPTREEISACRWLPDEMLNVYVDIYGSTGFQGGLNWYRCATDPAFNDKLRLFAGRTIDIPSGFIAGAQDWGIHQKPGALDTMQNDVCTDFRGCHLIEGAGHWVQQEQPEAVLTHLRAFLSGL